MVTATIEGYEGANDNLLPTPVPVAEEMTHVPFSSHTCGVCGGWMVYIRGRHPRDDRREVCPTCLADRMDDIRETAAKEYGVVYTAKEVVKLERL